MDFSKLQSVNNANPKGQNFKIKWNLAKQEFTLSEKLFQSMAVEYNSLRQFDLRDASAEGQELGVLTGVVLAVVPGDKGVFYKTNKGKTKGRRFKNSRLSNSCEELGILPENIDIIFEGHHEGNVMYKLVDSTWEESAEEEVVAESTPEPVLTEEPLPDVEVNVSETSNDRF